MPNHYDNVTVQVQNRSGHDQSHYNHFSSKCGTLTPVLKKLLIPNTDVNLSMSCQVQLPPMASDFLGHIDLKFEAFWVPLRLCYGGFQDFITHESLDSYPSGTPDNGKPQYLPYFNVPASSYGPGSLCDYLGYKVIDGTNSLKVDNPLPFVAYHLIWQEWYRNSFVQREAFRRVFGRSQTVGDYASTLPYTTFSGASPSPLQSPNLYDDKPIYSLRQRNWAKDYFTNAKPSPQAGNASQLAFQVDTSTGNGAFSIASLRAANALQLWLDRQNLAGFRYADQIKANFGVRPSDAVVDRPIYLGQQIVPVYTKGVSQTAPSEAASNRQPFNSVGTKVGQSVAVGNGHLARFQTTEYGYLMVLASLVPRSVYSSGTSRDCRYNHRSDFATPLLQGVGDQVIYKSELLTNGPGVEPTSGTTFGYAQRYADYKDMPDEVHGLLQDGQSLDMFTLQRSFSGDVQLGSSFLEIPVNYLDQVTATDNAASEFGYWADVWFDFGTVMPLSDYSIPTLGNPSDTHSVTIPNGGTQL